MIVDYKGEADYTTIQECVNAAQPGQSCLVRKGRYHEVVTITNKTDISIKGYGKERPIIDGTVELKPRGASQQWWQNHNGRCAAKIQVNTPHIFQLFYDGKMMTNARWPNALWSDKSVFYNTNWAKSDETSTRGTMVDNGSAGLATSGLNMTGAMAVLNIGSFNTFAKQVLWHEPNGNNFTYEDDFGSINFKPKQNQYFLDSKLELLDNPGEWFYEKETQKLYFIPPNGGACPDRDSGKLRGRTVTHSMVIRTTKNLFLKNLDFFASNVEAVGLTKNVDEIDEINLDSINFFYPSSSKRMLQDDAVPQRTKLVAKMHGSISVVNCTFFGAEGSALYYWSKKSKIHNNMFAWNDWSGHMGQKKNGGYGTVYSSPTSKNEEFIGNTLWYNGASAGYRSGKFPIISDNLIVGQGDGEIMHDGSGIQLQVLNEKL